MATQGVGMRTIMVVIFTVLLAGCASLIDPFYNRQVIEDDLQSESATFGTLAVTAERRIVVANLDNGTFCSEPPPEAAGSITNAIASTLSANVAEEGDVDAELASNFARHVNQLYTRAHTVQMFRDASFHLCVDAVNVGDGQGSYVSYQQSVMNLVKELKPVLEKEVDSYYATAKARAENPPPPVQKTVVCNTSAETGLRNEEDNGRVSTSIECRPIDSLKVEEND
jgi:hypothetical protein